MIGPFVLVGLVINARRNREVPSGARELLTEKPKHRFSPAHGAEIWPPIWQIAQGLEMLAAALRSEPDQCETP